jgi:hypothetical protein
MIPVYVSNNILVVKTFSSTSLCLAPLNSNKRDRSYREVFKAKIILNFTFPGPASASLTRPGPDKLKQNFILPGPAPESLRRPGRE